MKDAQTDWRKSITPLKHSTIQLPSDISSKCLKLCRMLNLNFAAIDFILDNNDDFVFLEVNPNGQWAWIEKQVNHPISDSISNLLIEKSNS